MATVTLALPHESETESVMFFMCLFPLIQTPTTNSSMSLLDLKGGLIRCAQNSKLSGSSLLIRFNDSTDFDELTEPVSPLHSFQVLRYFRKDGHNWRKKKDGKTVKEAHEKLKGTDACCFCSILGG
uniref:CG-1 domain-containing protein n=1 Tax=Brassica oleracea var. oleracea TaxID=109376 RepID=A0A0D3ANU8_BRAOL